MMPDEAMSRRRPFDPQVVLSRMAQSHFPYLWIVIICFLVVDESRYMSFFPIIAEIAAFG